MAQDFYDAFGLGSKETSINTIDADGVLLAGIQAMHEIYKEVIPNVTIRKEKQEEIEMKLLGITNRIAKLEKVLE